MTRTLNYHHHPASTGATHKKGTKETQSVTDVANIASTLVHRVIDNITNDHLGLARRQSQSNTDQSQEKAEFHQAKRIDLIPDQKGHFSIRTLQRQQSEENVTVQELSPLSPVDKEFENDIPQIDHHSSLYKTLEEGEQILKSIASKKTPLLPVTNSFNWQKS